MHGVDGTLHRDVPIVDDHQFKKSHVAIDQIVEIVHVVKTVCCRTIVVAAVVATAL